MPIDEPFARCVNSKCKGRARAKFLHVVGPRGLRLNEITVRIVDRIMAELGPLDVVDIFALDAAALDKIEPGLAERVRPQLDSVKRMPLWRFLHLSAIPQVCEHEARVLVRHVQTSARLEALTPSELSRLEGLSPEAVQGLSGWLTAEGPNQLARARQVGLTLLGDAEAFSAPFLTKTVVVAGQIAGGAMQLADEIERRGGIIQGRVGRDTDLVVVGQRSAKDLRRGGHVRRPGPR